MAKAVGLQGQGGVHAAVVAAALPLVGEPMSLPFVVRQAGLSAAVVLGQAQVPSVVQLSLLLPGHAVTTLPRLELTH